MVYEDPKISVPVVDFTGLYPPEDHPYHRSGQDLHHGNPKPHPNPTRNPYIIPNTNLQPNTDSDHDSRRHHRLSPGLPAG